MIHRNFLSALSLVVFGISLILLYYASTVYHIENSSEIAIKKRKKFDHAMIFVLIAGTYTPVCIVRLGITGIVLLSFVWSLALCGMLIELFGKSFPRFISTILYVALGWIVLIAFVPLTQAVEIFGVKLLVYGGISYTVGAVIYALKKPVINSIWFGSHELFHIFVMLGSLFHIVFMFCYI
jgi:hemolysin III